ncbi:hypothetical protein ABIE30_000966 [Janthinobacterium lividum]|uniref:DUF4365 domain-containing protein n=1 Tax=Janthinobacterium lividum TaxID=29581 RepID=UPI003D20DF82
MNFPQVRETYAQERLGIAAIQIYAARCKQIWRETGTGDVGIDGTLEFVSLQGLATGRIVAIQVKSGPSYFASPFSGGWKFYFEPKHKYYWELFPLPVLLVLHDPRSNVSYWADVRQALRTPGRGEKTFIEVFAYNVLEQTTPMRIFETTGAQDEPFIENIYGVLAKLLRRQSIEAHFPLSHFQLFTYGLTNTCRCIYYGEDVILHALLQNLEERNLDVANSSFNGMSDDEHHFVFDFVKFLLAQGLAHIDYADCLIDWIDRKMQPHFVAPLTARGRTLVSIIQQEEARLVVEKKLPNSFDSHVAQEGFFRMQSFSFINRFSRISKFQNLMISALNEDGEI